jgi:hypothetical protein
MSGKVLAFWTRHLLCGRESGDMACAKGVPRCACVSRRARRADGSARTPAQPESGKDVCMQLAARSCGRARLGRRRGRGSRDSFEVHAAAPGKLRQRARCLLLSRCLLLPPPCWAQAPASWSLHAAARPCAAGLRAAASSSHLQAAPLPRPPHCPGRTLAAQASSMQSGMADIRGSLQILSFSVSPLASEQEEPRRAQRASTASAEERQTCASGSWRISGRLAMGLASAEIDDLPASTLTSRRDEGDARGPVLGARRRTGLGTSAAVRGTRRGARCWSRAAAGVGLAVLVSPSSCCALVPRAAPRHSGLTFA